MIRLAVFVALLILFAGCGPQEEEPAPAPPDRSAARVRMARALLDQGMVADALEQLHRLPDAPEQRITPQHQPEWFEDIVSRLILRRALAPADSLLALTGPVADRPDALRALSANLMVLEGDVERAIATWASIRSDDPAMQVQVHHELATLYLMSGRAGEAEQRAREGLVLQPDRWQLRVLLGEALLAQDRPEEARAEVRRMEPGVARWQIEARIELEGFGDAGRAVELLQKAARAAPRNPDVRLQLGRALAAAGRSADARRWLEPLANQPVPFTGSRESLLEVYDSLGEEEAAARLRDQLAREDVYAEARRLRRSGLEASAAGELEVALAEFDRALEIAPEDANLHNDRGAVLARMERYGEAERAFLRAEELAPEDPYVQENLARLYDRTGDDAKRDAAIARWQEITGGEARQPD